MLTLRVLSPWSGQRDGEISLSQTSSTVMEMMLQLQAISELQPSTMLLWPSLLELQLSYDPYYEDVDTHTSFEWTQGVIAKEQCYIYKACIARSKVEPIAIALTL